MACSNDDYYYDYDYDDDDDDKLAKNNMRRCR